MIRVVNNMIDYYGNPCGYTKNGQATVDIDFKCEELSQWLEDENYEVLWKENIFEKLALNVKFFSDEEVKQLKGVRIWQLKNDADIDVRFVSYDDMCKRNREPNIEDYTEVFDGELYTNDLDKIYEICNLNHPEEYKGHSLSMSDVIELYDNQDSEFFYVDRFGFKQIEFTITEQENQMTQY